SASSSSSTPIARPSTRAPAPSAWEPRSAAACSKPAPCSTPSAPATSTPHSAARAATKRNRAPRSASTASATPSDSGTPRTSAPNCGASITAASIKARASASSAFQLDRTRRLALHPPGEHPHRAALLRQTAPHGGARGRPHPGGAQHAAIARRSAPNGDVPHALAGLHLLHRRHPLRGRHAAQNHRRDDSVPPQRAREPRHRSRPGRLHGNQEARGLFLMPVENLSAATAQWLEATSQTELLRFTTAGSVDDGKSTLIGRLLYDSKGVYEDQLASVRKATRNLSTNGLDLSLLTDGLRAEREQGITIDVAYRYFSTPRRKFIIADTPGHEEYTRNMATGASTANLAIILIYARYGVLPQSRRHAFLAALLGIPHLVVAVNKMDLMEFREDVFNAIRDEFRAFAAQIDAQIEDSAIVYIPISALDGDNVVNRSQRTPWYQGPALLEHLETVPIARDINLTDLRFPVQYVIRPNLDFRGFAGTLASGVVRRGDAITVLPSGRTSRVKSIVTWEGDLEEAFAPMSVTLCLEDEIDVSRGDMLVHPGNLPHIARRFDATVVWMNQKPLEPNRSYLIKHTTQVTQARVREIRYRIDVNTLEHQPARRLELNAIGVVSVEAQRPLLFDPYRQNRFTGSFILIDPITNETMGAGMILQAAASEGAAGRVTEAERRALRGHAPLAICLPPDRTDLAWLLERRLFDQGYTVHVIRQPESLRQAVLTALDAGLIAIVAPAGPADWDLLQQAVPPGQLVRAENVQQAMDAVARLVRPDAPLTGGDGI